MICVNKLSVEVAQWRSQRATKGGGSRQNVENSGKKGARGGGISTCNKPHVMKICIVAGRGN